MIRDLSIKDKNVTVYYSKELSCYILRVTLNFPKNLYYFVKSHPKVVVGKFKIFKGTKFFVISREYQLNNQTINDFEFIYKRIQDKLKILIRESKQLKLEKEKQDIKTKSKKITVKKDSKISLNPKTVQLKLNI